MFGDVDYNPSSSYKSVPIEEQLQVLAAAIDAGKVALLFAPYALLQHNWLPGLQPYSHGIILYSFDVLSAYTQIRIVLCLFWNSQF
jgi:hypothetical protein